MLRALLVGAAVVVVLVLLTTKPWEKLESGVVEQIGVTENFYPKLVVRQDDGDIYEDIYVNDPLPPRCIVGARWPECINVK